MNTMCGVVRYTSFYDHMVIIAQWKQTTYIIQCEAEVIADGVLRYVSN